MHYIKTAAVWPHTILQDIKTAAQVFGEVRKTRRAWASAVEIRPIRSIPIITLKPAPSSTMEGCRALNAGRDVYQAFVEVFKSLPPETQHWLEFTPEAPREWAARARFWQRELKPVLPPKIYHEVMVLFISWYAHCLRLEKEAQEVAV